MIEIELLLILAMMILIACLIDMRSRAIIKLLSQEDVRIAEEDIPADSNAQMIDLGKEDRDPSSGLLTEMQEDELDDLDRKLAEQDL